MRRPQQTGFTLLEVIIALAILAVSLVVLLQSQAVAMDSAGRSRDITVAALLLRSKMIDIEKHLFHDGFTLNSEEDDGDFRDEDHPEIKWQSRISEVKLDISALTSICGALPKVASVKKGDEDTGTAKNDCESQLNSLGQMLAPYTEELGRSMRAVEIVVRWPVGRYEETMSVRSLLTRDDFGTEQQTDAARLQNQLGGSNAAGGMPPAASGATPTTPVAAP